MHVLGLQKAFANCSFWAILRNQSFANSVTREFLTSSSFRLINPRGHRIATDQVALRFPTPLISGLNDEAVLALFTRGFFGGLVFRLERFILKIGLAKIMPARYTGTLSEHKPNHWFWYAHRILDSGLTSLPTEKIEWNPQNISKSAFIPVGDILFGSFKLVDSHIKQTTSESEPESDPLPSYLDFGFGSDTSNFGGCHRFSVHRDLHRDLGLDTKSSSVTDKHPRQVQDEVEIRLEHFSFICNPWTNVDSWPEYMTWFHRWYERLLFMDGIRGVLRR